MKPNKTHKPRYKSVADFAAANGLRDWQLAELLGCHRGQAQKLRKGRGYRSLIEPLRVAKRCQIPIEALLPSEAA